MHRFSDRDSIMRYQWGMGIGHTYAYSGSASKDTQIAQEKAIETSEDKDDDATSIQSVSSTSNRHADEDDVEFGGGEGFFDSSAQ